MNNRYEIVMLRDKTYVLLDKENCYWLFGFAVGQNVWIELKDGYRLEGTIVSVRDNWVIDKDKQNDKHYYITLAYRGNNHVLVGISEAEIIDIGEWLVLPNEDIH